MKFELDEYYFNRAGDKVKYVGWPVNDDLFHFRREEGFLYSVNYHGFANPGFEESKDILGKWEINDDPDRVYVNYTGLELRCKGRYQNNSYGLVSDGAPSILYLHKESEIKKILIKPRKLGTGLSLKDLLWRNQEDQRAAEKAYNAAYKEYIDKQPKKIEPLHMPADSRALSLTDTTLKLNELITAFNERLG